MKFYLFKMLISTLLQLLTSLEKTFPKKQIRCIILKQLFPNTYRHFSVSMEDIMKLVRFMVKKYVFLFVFVFGILALSHNAFGSTISGIVYDNQRNPLVEVDVELQDDLYRMIGRAKTTGSGRYEFGGLRNGTYTVRVMAFRYDFLDQSMSVEIAAMSSIPNQDSNQYVTQDFYLSPRKGSLTETELGVVFAQEVPRDAQKSYDDAVKDLARKRTDEGIIGLRRAVTTFPKYYAALHRLGKELFIKSEYGEAVQVLMRASEVNPKSPTDFYYMGYSLLKLNYSKAALIPLKQALLIAPSSIQVLFALGTAEEAEGKYTDAEKHLLEAKKLSKVGVPEIHWQLAQLYGNNLKKYKEAANELELYLKAGKFDEQQTAKVKKLIIDLRKKSEAQVANK